MRKMNPLNEGKKPFKCEFSLWQFEKNTLYQFMMVKNLSNVLFVTKSSQKKNLNVHIASVHDRKRPFKCDIFNPGNALARVQRVHELADLWDITFCTR